MMSFSEKSGFAVTYWGVVIKTWWLIELTREGIKREIKKLDPSMLHFFNFLLLLPRSAQCFRSSSKSVFIVQVIRPVGTYKYDFRFNTSEISIIQFWIRISKNYRLVQNSSVYHYERIQRSIDLLLGSLV